MRKTMKRFLTAALSALAFVAIGFGVLALKAVDVAKAENVNLKIVGKTLNVSNNVNVVFFVPEEAGTKADITVHVTEKESTGDVESTLTADDTDYINEGKTYYRFVYRGVTAYEMENELIAYAELNGDVSPSVKYSILEYAYKKLGKADKEKDTTEGLEDLLKATLNYGSAAAKYKDKTLPADFSYEDDYTYVSVANATFEDGFSHGVFKKGAELTVSPNEGYKLADSYNTDIYSVDSETITLKVPNEKLIDTTLFVEDTSVDAATKVEYELSQISMSATSAYVGDTLTLKTTPVSYDDVTITWFATGATLDGNVVTFDTVGDVTLTVTVACDGVSDSKTFENIIDVTENPYPVEGKAYALKTTDNYYVTSIGTNNFVPTENASDAALSFYFEKVGEGTYNILCGSTNKYVGGESGGTDLMFSADPTTGYTWTLDVDKKLMTSDNDRFLGRNGSSIKHYAKTNVNSYPHVWFEEIIEWTDADKVQYEADNFVKEYSASGGVDCILPTQTDKFEASITWDLVGSYDCVESLENGVLKTTNPAADQQVEVTATLSLNGVNSEPIPCTVTIKHVSAEKTQVKGKYTFSSYTAGKQYAQGEEHALDENVKLTINGAHLNTQVRLYAGSNAVLSAGNNYYFGGTVTINAGYKAGALTVYASMDGSTWTQLEIFKTTTGYNDFTIVLSAQYQCIKLEATGAQIRVASVTFA